MWSESLEGARRDIAPNGMLESWNNGIAGVASGSRGLRLEKDTVFQGYWIKLY